MAFHMWEVPVAYSMFNAAQTAIEYGPVPFQTFLCYWTAFNNIYVVIAEQHGHQVQIKKHAYGSIKTRSAGNVQIPEVKKNLTERDQLDLAFGQFSDDLKHRLIIHPSTKFFAERTPSWRGNPIEFDTRRQRLNGVLNVGHTINISNPIWSPIDLQKLEQYLRDGKDNVARDELAKQIFNLLYTVRNNTFHGGKRFDDANDLEVLP